MADGGAGLPLARQRHFFENDIPSDIPSDVEGYDCRFATYCKSYLSKKDVLVIKEYEQKKSGERTPNLRIIENFRRDFYVTKEGYRKHKQKKEWEEIHKLQKFSCTQAELPAAISRALGMPGVNWPLKQLANNVYLYGSDIHTTSLIKKRYQDKWPTCIGPTASVAVMDIETDVLPDANGKISEEIIVITLSFKDRVVTAVTRSFLDGMIHPEQKIRAAFDNYLGEVKQKRNIDLTLVIGDTPAECIKAVMEKAHLWMPDFITFWNINFDMPKIIKALEKENCILADIFSDPRVPVEYRHFDYIEGPAQKKTQSGKIMALHPADRWHQVKCPASFFFLDSMCLYKRLRLAKGQEPSYGLDAVLKRNDCQGKLHFDALNGVSKLEWHQEMQKRFKAEYVIYNIFDCIGVELLDEKIGDIHQAFPALCELSDYADFKSTPRRIINDLHYFVQEHKLVIASCGTDVEEDLDQYVIPMTDMIITLPSHMSIQNGGVPVIRDLPDVFSLMTLLLADLDVEGTYPNAESVQNMSKETTVMEFSAFKDIPLYEQRHIGVNLTGGPINAVEICTRVFTVPQPAEWLAQYQKEKMREVA